MVDVDDGGSLLLQLYVTQLFFGFRRFRLLIIVVLSNVLR